MKNYSALVCDLDMTLIDSKKDIAASVVFAAKAIGKKSVCEKDVTPWIGKGLKTMFHELLPDIDPKTEEKAVATYKEHFYDHCHIYTKIYPKVIDTLKSLRKHDVKTAVATAKMSFMAKRVCRVLGLDEFIDHIQGTDNMPGKPHPAVVLSACQLLGVKPENTVFVGDTVMDIEAAKRAGCTTAAVTYGIGKREALLEKEPDLIIDSFDEILDFFF